MKLSQNLHIAIIILLLAILITGIIGYNGIISHLDNSLIEVQINQGDEQITKRALIVAPLSK